MYKYSQISTMCVFLRAERERCFWVDEHPIFRLDKTWVLLLRHAYGASTFSKSLGGAARLVVPKLQQSCTSLLASELRNVCSFFKHPSTDFHELVQSSRTESGSICRMIGKHCPFCPTVFGKRAWTWTSFWVLQPVFSDSVEKVWLVHVVRHNKLHLKKTSL